MEKQSDAERKAAAFDALARTLETLGPRGAWADSPDDAREAAATMLGALRDALAAGGYSIDSQSPVLSMLAALGDLQQGHETWLIAGLPARSRRPPESIERIAYLALACATVDVLRRGGKEINEAIHEVAVAARVTPKFLRDWRKALRSDRKPEGARPVYDEAITAVQLGYTQYVERMNAESTPRPPDFARKFYRLIAEAYLEKLRMKGHP
jgi:hypothetical protein